MRAATVETKLHVREWTGGVDRSEWSDGAWRDEPDKVQWVDVASGLDCLMHRNRMGAWCGYVGVAEGHEHFEKPYDGIGADVHGGLTYSDFCQDVKDESHGICHVPVEGRPHRVWWLGFDCAHLYDRSPGMDASNRKYGWDLDEGWYKDRRYVESEVTKLASQFAGLPPQSEARV